MRRSFLGVLSLFLLLMGGLAVFQPAAKADPAQSEQMQVTLTSRALRHIMERHWPDSPASGAGKFQAGITPNILRDLINESVRDGRARPNTHGRPGTIYEYDFQRPIGTTIDGGPASRLRVVVNNRNEVITAFPF